MPGCKRGKPATIGADTVGTRKFPPKTQPVPDLQSTTYNSLISSLVRLLQWYRPPGNL